MSDLTIIDAHRRYAETQPHILAALILVIARLLYPKLRKRSGRLGGKGAPGSARAAVLNYLAALEPSELGPIAELFFAPLSGAFRTPDTGEEPSPDAFAEWRCGPSFASRTRWSLREGIDARWFSVLGHWRKVVTNECNLDETRMLWR